MAKIKYKNVDTRTLDGLKKAEKLHAKGWKMTIVGLYKIQFYKKGG